MMTVGEFKAWLRENDIPDEFGIDVATFADSGVSGDDIQGIKVNSGGRSVQLEIYPDGWKPLSEGSTRIR